VKRNRGRWLPTVIVRDAVALLSYEPRLNGPTEFDRAGGAGAGSGQNQVLTGGDRIDSPVKSTPVRFPEPTPVPFSEATGQAG